MQRPMVPPSPERLRIIGKKLGIELSEEDSNSYHEYMKDVIGLYKALEKYPEPTLPVKYPRTPGYQPSASENKYNAWYWKTDIKGATEGKLLGKTIAIKDCIAVAGVPMMNGSRLLEGYVPEFDATVVTKVLDEGAVISGKAACEDLNLGSKGLSNAFGPTLHPMDQTRASGGSSSGCVALVAAGEVDMAIGADQGGSIRVPCANTGLVGIKPTYGLIPYTGAYPIEYSVDTLGPIAKTVSDAALLLEVMAGFDDGLDARQPGYKFPVPEYTKLLTEDLTGLRIGLVKEGFDFCDSKVAEKVHQVALELSAFGATVENINVPIHEDGRSFCVPANYSGAYENMIRSCGFPVGLKGFYASSIIQHMGDALRTPKVNALQPAVKACMLLGEYMKQDYDNRHYAKTANLQRLLRQSYDEHLKTYDALIMPTTQSVATKLPPDDLPPNKWIEHSVGAMINTMPFNYTGHPAISVKAGLLDGLPVGLMVIGRMFDESTILRVAYSVEAMTKS